MKLPLLLIVLVIVIVLGALIFTRQEAGIPQPSATLSVTVPTVIPSVATASSPVPVVPPSTPRVGSVRPERVHQEALRVSNLDRDPAKTEGRLEALAASLKNEDLERVAAEAADPTAPADDRMMDVYLLARGQAPRTAELLIGIARGRPAIDPTQ